MGVDGDKPVLRVLEGTRDDGTLVLCLQGDIDMATVGTLALHLDHIGDRARSVLVDLRRAGFLDCLGLRVLVDAHRDASARGDDIEFTQGPPAVRRMFELTGTLGLLPFAETA